MRVVIGPQPHRTAFRRPAAPVGEQLVAQQQAAIGAAQPRLLTSRAFPHARIVPHECLVGRATEVLARDQAVGHVLARERLVIDQRLSRNELVAIHVAADRTRTVGKAIWEPRVGREQQEVRAPALPRRQDELPRAILGDFVGTILVHTLRHRNARAALAEHKFANEHPIVQRHLPGRNQLLIGVVRRVAGTGGADVAAGVVHAARAAAARRGDKISRQRQRRKLQAALFGPALENLQVIRERHRPLWVRG